MKKLMSQDEFIEFLEGITNGDISDADGYLIGLEDYSVKWKRGVDWKGYEVYYPIFKKPAIVGLPYVVLIKDGKARVSTADESLEYLEFEDKS